MNVLADHHCDVPTLFMTPQTKSVLKYVISVLLTIVFLYITFRDTDFEKLYDAMRGANYWWMVLMFACLMASHGFRALRWRYLLDPVKPDIPFRNLFSGVMIGYFINNLLPRAGELVRPYTIAKLETIPKSAALGTIVVERIMDTVSFLILVSVIPMMYDGPLTQVFPWLQEAGRIVTLITFVVLLCGILLMVRRDWTDFLLSRIARLMPSGFASKFDHVVHSFLDGFEFMKRPRGFAAIFSLSVLVWFLYILMTYVAFYSFGLQDKLGFGSALVVLAISSIGVAIPTPGATGGYHWFAAQSLIGLFNVSNEVALSFATVTHAVGFVGATIVGLYFFLHDHINVKDALNKPMEQVQ